MLREKVAKLTKLMFAGATMALCVATINPASQVQAAMLEESEDNDSRATADKLPLNTWIRGSIGNVDDEDWYEISIPAGSGYSEVEITPSEDNTYYNSAWQVYLYDSKRHELIHRNAVCSYKDIAIGLTAGKYYVKVACQYSNTGLDGTYNLMVHYTNANQWEKEQYVGYKSIKNANILYANKTYTGNLYCGDDVDYYRLKLNGTNKVSLKFTIDDSVSNPGTWRIKFREYKSKKILADYYISTNETITVPKCTGDVIFEISNNYDASGQIYHICASAKSNTVKKPSATTISSIKSGKNQATVYWRKANNATGYYVYRSTSANSGYKKIATVTGKTFYTDKKSLKSKKTYYYKVVSIRKSGSKVLTAKSSAAKKVKIK